MSTNTSTTEPDAVDVVVVWHLPTVPVDPVLVVGVHEDLTEPNLSIIPADCGASFQIDAYRGTHDAINTVIGDGELTDGEAAGILRDQAASSFVHLPPCDSVVAGPEVVLIDATSSSLATLAPATSTSTSISTSTAPSPDQALATTGVHPGILVMAMLLLVAGAAMLMVFRRRVQR